MGRTAQVLFGGSSFWVGGKILTTKSSMDVINAVDSTHESENSSIRSPAMSSELEQQQGRSMPSPDQLKQSPVMEIRSPAPETATPAEAQSKLTLSLPVWSSWI
ncbi:hypothetical protein LWI28_005895 [Acer negundo]|uniref:Uncharacterized protein n=1 Tax=Acer negundo TaxID=4023 RepID=A0AAD5NGU3_ACENE|nr:hypothetical protein LWI28_005895 [Acer negundo]